MAKSEYSKIASIEVKNFRNIGSARVDFEKSPIVCLIGDNEAGKTSFNMATTVCATNVDPKSQKGYIRDRTPGFGVKITLEDGHAITRIKKTDSNMYEVHKDGKEVYSASKLAEGLPVIVQDLMGIVLEEETGELLQVRTYEDKLLFAYTTGTVNKKMMYNALKVKELTDAIKIGNSDINAIRSSKDNTEVAIGTIMGQLKGINTVDISIVSKLKENFEVLDSKEVKASLLVGTKLSIDSDYSLYRESADECERIAEINDRQLSLISMLSNLKADSDRYVPDVGEHSEISISTIKGVSQLVELKKQSELFVPNTEDLSDLSLAQARMEKANKLVELADTISGADLDIYSDIFDMHELMSNQYKVLESLLVNVSNINNTIVTLEETLAEINECEQFLADNGNKVVTCPNCGETILIEN